MSKGSSGFGSTIGFGCSFGFTGSPNAHSVLGTGLNPGVTGGAAGGVIAGAAAGSGVIFFYSVSLGGRPSFEVSRKTPTPNLLSAFGLTPRLAITFR